MIILYFFNLIVLFTVPFAQMHELRKKWAEEHKHALQVKADAKA